MLDLLSSDYFFDRMNEDSEGLVKKRKDLWKVMTPEDRGVLKMLFKKKKTGNKSLDDLPVEVLQMIFCFCELKHLNSVARTVKYFNNIINAEVFWQLHAKQHYPTVNLSNITKKIYGGAIKYINKTKSNRKDFIADMELIRVSSDYIGYSLGAEDITSDLRSFLLRDTVNAVLLQEAVYKFKNCKKNDDGYKIAYFALLEVRKNHSMRDRTYRYLGSYEYDQANYSAAEKYYEAALKYNNNALKHCGNSNGETNKFLILCLLGKTKYKLRRYKEAKTIFEEAKEMRCESVSANRFLGLIEYELANYTKAKELFDFVSRKNPGDKKVAEILAKIAEKTNDKFKPIAPSC